MAPGRRTVQLQGPRPSPLSINKESRKIGKTPLAQAPPPQPPREPLPENRKPVIIYDVSPKVIHIDVSEFKSVVQRLTGLCSSSTVTTRDPISPAVRLASIERVSPTGRGRSREVESELLDMVGWKTGEMDFGQTPGILSPEPENFPLVTTGMFSSGVESQTQFGFQENMMYEHYYLPSPSTNTLFSGATMLSPTPSPVFDISSLFDC